MASLEDKPCTKQKRRGIDSKTVLKKLKEYVPFPSTWSNGGLIKEIIDGQMGLEANIGSRLTAKRNSIEKSVTKMKKKWEKKIF